MREIIINIYTQTHKHVTGCVDAAKLIGDYAGPRDVRKCYVNATKMLRNCYVTATSLLRNCYGNATEMLRNCYVTAT